MEAILSVDRQSLPRPINNRNPETERNESAPTGPSTLGRQRNVCKDVTGDLGFIDSKSWERLLSFRRSYLSVTSTS